MSSKTLSEPVQNCLAQLEELVNQAGAELSRHFGWDWIAVPVHTMCFKFNRTIFNQAWKIICARVEKSGFYLVDETLGRVDPYTFVRLYLRYPKFPVMGCTCPPKLNGDRTQLSLAATNSSQKIKQQTKAVPTVKIEQMKVPQSTPNPAQTVKSIIKAEPEAKLKAENPKIRLSSKTNSILKSAANLKPADVGFLGGNLTPEADRCERFPHCWCCDDGEPLKPLPTQNKRQVSWFE